MISKICIDCEKRRLIKFFGIARRWVSKKGKGISIHWRSYCNDCQYKRNRRCMTRNKIIILKYKKYQKKYNPNWQKKYRKKSVGKKSLKKLLHITFSGLAKATKRWLVCRVAFAKPVLQAGVG